MAKEETKNYVRSKIYTNGNHEVSAQNTVEALDKMIDDSDNVEQQVATLGAKVGELDKTLFGEGSITTNLNASWNITGSTGGNVQVATYVKQIQDSKIKVKVSQLVGESVLYFRVYPTADITPYVKVDADNTVHEIDFSEYQVGTEIRFKVFTNGVSNGSAIIGLEEYPASSEKGLIDKIEEYEKGTDEKIEELKETIDETEKKTEGLEDVQILCDSIKTEFGAEKSEDGKEIPLPPIQDGYITITGAKSGGLNHYSINVASYPIGKRLSVIVGSQKFTTSNTSILGVNKGGVGGTDFKLLVGSIGSTQVSVDEVIEIDGSFDTILISVRSSSISVNIIDLEDSYTFSKIEDIKEAKESADKALQAISSDKKKETPIVLPEIETGYYRINGSFVPETYFHYSIPIDKNGNDGIRLIGKDGGSFASDTTAVILVRNNGNFVRTILSSTPAVKAEFDEIVDIDGTFDEVIVCFRNPSFFEAFYLSAQDRISALEGDLMGIEQRVEKLEEGFTSKKYKILVVGNSFSIRGITVGNASLLDLCKKAGIRCYAEVIGNSGARLSSNYSKYVANTACEYHMYGDESTGWSSHNGDGFTIKEAIEKEDWDYIVFHQGSPDSGTIATYEPYLGDFIREAKLHCPNEYVKIGLQLTWAYANLTDIYPISPSTSPSTSTAFATQMEFYEAIVNCYKSESEEHNINYVIPSGTAIQNARGTKLGTEHSDFAASTSDAVHINAYGSVLTALAWFAILIGRDNNISIKDIPKFSTLYDDDDYELVKKCVTNAVKLPYIVNVPL